MITTIHPRDYLEKEQHNRLSERARDLQWLSERSRNLQWLDDRLYDLDYYSLYPGDEMNTHHFDWEQAIKTGTIRDSFRVVLMNMLATRDTLSSPAIPLFYEELYEYNPSWIVERSLCPPTRRNQELMKKDGISPFALESKMPLTAFDVLCCSMDMHSCMAAVPWILMESSIPLLSKNRTMDDPILILGGASIVNPAPLAPFCDIIFMGEGEEVLPELIELLEQGKRKGLSRTDILLSAARYRDCLYVPQFYEERYDRSGRFEGTFPVREDVPRKIRYYRVRDLDTCFVPTRPYLDFYRNVDIKSIQEISKGCEGKCSFCMPCFLTLPFRPRSAALVKKNRDKLMFETGVNSAVMVSFNAVSHPEINRIIRDAGESVGANISALTQRMDSFRANPEYCCFLSVQNNGRSVFGVEGASQRLRDRISKNLSEEQILEAMHMICRSGNQTVKFMMICNLPGESREDLDELYRLALKIKQIFISETLPGKKTPRLLITWTPLTCFPHTPMQWMKISRTMPSYYEEFTQKISEIGFRTYTPVLTADAILSQLFVRGDGRLSLLLAHMASEGLLWHEEGYSQEDLNQAVHFLDDNCLPDLDEWFREYGPEDPMPWEIVESPASKPYLYQRYLEMWKDRPRNSPVCTSQCTGCGACDKEDRKKLGTYPALREKDAKISLRNIAKRYNPVSKQYVVMKFEYDLHHAFVHHSYWDAEIRRALNKAGISYDPDSVRSVRGRFRKTAVFSTGPNITGITLTQRYEPGRLREMIQDNAVNFRISELTEISHPLRLKTITYRMKLPEDTDLQVLNQSLSQKLLEDVWRMEQYQPSSGICLRIDIRPGLRSVKTDGRSLLMTLDDEAADPSDIYRYCLDIPHEVRLQVLPERIGFELY